MMTTTCLGLSALLHGCGGGDGGAATGPGSSPDDPAALPVTTVYANSVVGGGFAPQSITYTAATATVPASVDASTASALLPAGASVVVAEHVDSRLPGLREVCVSGDGQSINVVAGINLGVVAKSAALLLDSSWSAVADSAAVWAAYAAAGSALSGWENCGVKPEGLPSVSTRLVPHADGSYTEDVYDGNPSTTFNTLTQYVSAAQVAAMLSASGYPSPDDPARPLRLYLRAYRNDAGARVLLQTGVADGAATPPLQGYIALYALSP
ncbi:MAG: hypothetical protein ACREX7_09375 [Casimicrobiaceae bacterium]